MAARIDAKSGVKAMGHQEWTPIDEQNEFGQIANVRSPGSKWRFTLGFLSSSTSMGFQGVANIDSGTKIDVSGSSSSSFRSTTGFWLSFGSQFNVAKHFHLGLAMPCKDGEIEGVSVGGLHGFLGVRFQWCKG